MCGSNDTETMDMKPKLLIELGNYFKNGIMKITAT